MEAIRTVTETNHYPEDFLMKKRTYHTVGALLCHHNVRIGSHSYEKILQHNSQQVQCSRMELQMANCHMSGFNCIKRRVISWRLSILQGEGLADLTLFYKVKD